jgi:hypothetical protein
MSGQDRNEGWGNRNQDFGDPDPDHAGNPDPGTSSNDTSGTGNSRGKEPTKVSGAEGNPPQQDIKPATKLDIDQKT